MFASLALVVFVVVAVTVWQRSSRRGRLQWLSKLSLPGQWTASDGSRIEFAGGLDHGDYEWRRAGATERGSWRYTGHMLTFTPSEGASHRFDVRLYDAGKISLTPKQGSALLLEKRSSNVVPLFRGGE